MNRRIVVLCFLLAVAFASYEVILTDRATYNLGVGSFTGGSVTAVNTDDPEANFVAADLNTLRFYPELLGSYLVGLDYSVVLPENIIQARFRSDGGWAAVIGNTTNNVYLLTKSPTNYSVHQTIDLGSKPNSLWWAINDAFLAVGLANGTITVLKQNSIFSDFYIWKRINTNHTGGVAHIVGKTARIYSLGANDQTLKSWYYNLTTSEFSLNQTLVYSATSSAPTAFHISGNEKRVGIGRANGDILILGRTDNNLDVVLRYTLATAHLAAVNFLRFDSIGWHLLSGGAVGDGTVQLRSRKNNWGTPTNYTLNGQSVDWDNVNKQYTIGTYGNNDGTFYTKYLTATNCTGTSVNSSDPTRCVCPTGQVWFQGTCQVLLCSDTNFTNIAAGVPNATDNNMSCNCNPGYVWEEAYLTCRRDCNASVTPNSSGQNYEYLSCVCNAGYQWDYQLVACVRYQNCTGVDNSNGSNVNSNECFCDFGYYWNATWNTTNGGACQLNCSLIAGTRGFSDVTSCNCEPGFEWDSASRSCFLNCATMPYSTGVLNGVECKCQSDYRWDATIQHCVSAKSNHAVAIACGIAIPLGVLGLLALAALLWWCCRPATSVPIPTPMPVAQPISTIPVQTVPVSQVIAKPLVVPQPMTSMTRLIPGGMSGFSTPATGVPIARF